ncbi:hypothetical protein CKO28_07760 [Rhodovibrio sodomensis]|uniref:Transporter n=1 Tax=Rhodovibrio sodomensis TaxID=1088 RepID=A0ABS1DC16_9PROT|nr:hypothetical protein [Rhodovibrio sodomensis]MBK1667930.1 hypothetical protein [Rhodovibrio sodomensis]
MPVVVGRYRTSNAFRAGARAPLAGLAAVLCIAGVGVAMPVGAADLRLADDHLSMRVAPRVARQAPFGGSSPAEVGLESMLRAQAATPGPDMAVEVGHYGAARHGDRPEQFDQRLGVRGQLSNVLTLPSGRLAADLSGGYQVGDMAAFDTGTLQTTFTLRASPLDRLSTRTEIGWWGQRPAEDGTWVQGGHGRLGLSYALPDFGTIGAFERLGVSGPRGQRRHYETGVQLDFGAHSLSVSQRLETLGRVSVGPPATAAAYGWQVGPLGLAMGADYTAASETAPAAGFAGLAVTLGLAGPGPGALLDALR